MKTNRQKIIELTLLVVVIAVGFLAITNQQQIRDWWVLRSYEPPTEITALSQDTAMSEEGQRLFFASQPEIHGRESFNDFCQFPEKSLVLGCYATQRIYIFDVEDERLDGVKEVTAAHEMLHAAYDRLSNSERERVDNLVNSAFEQLGNDRIKDTAENYQDDGHGSLNNELHSILGTEASELPEELEQYYGQYFTDRSVITQIAASYEQVFVEIQEEIKQFDEEISELRQRIEDTEQTLAKEQSELETESQRLEQLRQSGQIAAYNQAVPAYNSAVNTYNERINTYVALVERHNRLVEERNSLAVEQNSLVHSLDSQFQPVESE